MKIEDMPISRIVWRNVDGLSANDYNPNVVYSPELRLLRFSLLRQGWIQPVLVTKDGTIIDGFHRASLVKTDKEVRALTKGKVPCVEMDLDEADRMLLTIRINRAKGSHIALKMADIIKTLVNDHGLSLDEICSQIGATKDEVDLLLMENVFKAKGIDEKTPFSRAWIPAVKGGRRLGGGTSGAAVARKPAQKRKNGHGSAGRR